METIPLLIAVLVLGLAASPAPQGRILAAIILFADLTVLHMSIFAVTLTVMVVVAVILAVGYFFKLCLGL